MTKTSQDVCVQALRHLTVCAMFEQPNDEDKAQALVHLESAFASLDDTEGLAFDWTIETVPDAVFLPLSIMVAGSLSVGYSMPQYASEYKRGMGMVKAYENAKNIVDGQPLMVTYY